MSNVINFPKKHREFESYEKLFDAVKDELAGWDIASVAECAGVAPATLYFWLDGSTKSPQLRTVAKVVEVLGYELELGLEHRTAKARRAK